jgi:hypothetical protein
MIVSINESDKSAEPETKPSENMKSKLCEIEETKLLLAPLVNRRQWRLSRRNVKWPVAHAIILCREAMAT